MNNKITIQTIINAPAANVWQALNDTEAMKVWGAASEDWHTVSATNDVRVGGTMAYRMEAKDGSAGFDLSAVYNEVTPNEHVLYTMADNRTVDITLHEVDGITTVTEVFDPESQNPPQYQQAGWQAILDNLKKYVESK